MSRELDALTAHFADLSMQSLTVPELPGPDGGALTIHWKPITTAQMAQIKHRCGKRETMLQAFTVILCARREDGTRMFEDKPDTVKLWGSTIPARIVSKVAMAMLGEGDEGDLSEEESAEDPLA